MSHQSIIYDNVLIRPFEQDVASMSEAIVRHTGLRGREVNAVKIQGIATSAVFMFRGPGVRGSSENLIPSQRQTITSHTSYHNEESNVSDRPLWFRRQHISHLQIPL